MLITLRRRLGTLEPAPGFFGPNCRARRSRLALLPTFCRHNRFIERCPICRDSAQPALRANAGARAGATRRPKRSGAARRGRADDLRVRRELRAEDDGYACALVPGLKASDDARRLADELAYSAGRLAQLATAPPGPYADVASEPDREQATWLAFLIAYLSPVEGDDPFAGIDAARTRWDAPLPELADVPLGPRTAHERARGTATLEAYRGWARRAGSQAEGFIGDRVWTPERRFDRVFERLALSGFGRAPRYELLVSLGALGIYELRASSVQLGADDTATLAAKRVFGIGDRLNLERRAAELAHACEIAVEALDLALYNWGAERRATLGAGPDAADSGVRTRAAAALDVARVSA